MREICTSGSVRGEASASPTREFNMPLRGIDIPVNPNVDDHQSTIIRRNANLDKSARPGAHAVKISALQDPTLKQASDQRPQM